MEDTKSNEQLLFSIHVTKGVKLLSWLRLNLSHLQKLKFTCERVGPMCRCRLEIESTQHFLGYHFYDVEKIELFNSLYDI